MALAGVKAPWECYTGDYASLSHEEHTVSWHRP